MISHFCWFFFLFEHLIVCYNTLENIKKKKKNHNLNLNFLFCLVNRQRYSVSFTEIQNYVKKEQIHTSYKKMCLYKRKRKNYSKRSKKHAEPVGGNKVYVNDVPNTKKNLLSLRSDLILFK